MPSRPEEQQLGLCGCSLKARDKEMQGGYEGLGLRLLQEGTA